MSIWVELRCEDAAESHAEERYTGRDDGRGGRERSRCYSHDNMGCGQMSGTASQKSLLETYRSVCSDAAAIGWKRIGGNWVCPHCVEFRDKDNA